MELFHVLNRGVDKRNIFVDSKDYARFAHSLLEFNDEMPADQSYIRRSRMTDFVNPSLAQERIVEIYGWCLMRNHFHLLLSEKREGGLTRFLRKLNVGYANYFNEKYDRGGALFQGRTKRVPVTSDAHFLYILHYIHLNPLDYFPGAREWRLGRIKNAKNAIEHIRAYRWSSYSDYCGIQSFPSPSVITKDLFAESLGPIEAATMEYLKDLEAEDGGLQALHLE